jgi:hypothetical protein
VVKTLLLPNLVNPGVALVGDLHHEREVITPERRGPLPAVLVVRTIQPGNLHGVRAAAVVVLVEPHGSDNLSQAILVNGLILFC